MTPTIIALQRINTTDPFPIITADDVPDLLAPVTRHIHTVFIHCSASDRPEHDSAAVIDRWHRNPPRHWSGIGYHVFIRKDGTIQHGRDFNRTPAAQQGHNRGTLALCLHGLHINRFTNAQRSSLNHLCAAIDRTLSQRNGQRIRFRGHCEVSTKSCPVIDYRHWLNLNAAGHRNGTTQPTTRPSSSQPGATHTTPEPRLDATHYAHPKTTNANVHTLTVGDNGPQVARLQRALNQWGQNLVIDGLYGRATTTAVRAYQRHHWPRLKIDGIAGPNTLNHLRQSGYFN